MTGRWEELQQPPSPLLLALYCFLPSQVASLRQDRFDHSTNSPLYSSSYYLACQSNLVYNSKCWPFNYYHLFLLAAWTDSASPTCPVSLFFPLYQPWQSITIICSNCSSLATQVLAKHAFYLGLLKMLSIRHLFQQ